MHGQAGHVGVRLPTRTWRSLSVVSSPSLAQVGHALGIIPSGQVKQHYDMHRLTGLPDRSKLFRFLSLLSEILLDFGSSLYAENIRLVLQAFELDLQSHYVALE